MPWTRVAGAGVLVTAGALAARYTVQRSRIERSWPRQVAPRLAQIGEVDQVSILPLVERLVPDGPPGLGGRLHGEPGVAYLIRAGTTTVLFDVGFNPRGRAQSALAGNADTLHVQLGSVDAVVISHLHADHVGGSATSVAARFRSRRNRWSLVGYPPMSRWRCPMNALRCSRSPHHGSSRREWPCCRHCRA